MDSSGYMLQINANNISTVFYFIWTDNLKIVQSNLCSLKLFLKVKLISLIRLTSKTVMENTVQRWLSYLALLFNFNRYLAIFLLRDLVQFVTN